MTKFGFVIHALETRDAVKRYPWMRFLSDSMIESLLKLKKPSVVSHITGIQSSTGAKTEGWFIALPMTPNMMVNTCGLEWTNERIVTCTELARAEGADLIGLGAFTSVVGDGGVTIQNRSKIAVTTGNSYTVATAIEAARKGAQSVDLELSEATLAVVGATGSIGRTCAEYLSPLVANTILLGRDLSKTEKVAQELVRATASNDAADLRRADILITVSSAGEAIVFPEHLKPGAVVIDVARPRDVSRRVADERPDVLVIEGGLVRVPGTPDFGIDFGFPKGTAYACMSETMMLALEGRAESFTLGKTVSLAQVEETLQLAQKHGFTLEGFRSFEREVGQEAINRAREAREKTRIRVS